MSAQPDTISADRARLERERLEFERNKSSRLTAIVSTVAIVVSVLQVGVAYLQSKLATAQTIEKFIPYLQKQETRDAALLTMLAFADKDLVTHLAESLRATAVLETVQASGNQEQRDKATAALSDLERSRQALLTQIYAQEKTARVKATTELVRQWNNDPKLVPQVIDHAEKQLADHNGTINALVVLREASPEALRANAADLLPFLAKAANNGAQSSGLAAEIVAKGRLDPTSASLEK
ncbi:hypothetical protein [Duganella sp. Root1480D1]|uniref:hypothetical protein n=1 Tax=Duganella sp. Root1480D1 TaxID=1736471 RepID=UPI00070B9FFB|nr:hypothetical protein [Duganella sp. Root1480D1]KQZ32429.1 hypothetical protein ASD58_07250 [Duganella sp. Root1480D1]